MRVTEVNIRLQNNPRNPSLLAVCSIVVEGHFVIHDVKVIAGKKGPFVAMPQRKRTYHCQDCNASNPLNHNYCHHCGVLLDGEPLAIRDCTDDVVHPITYDCRDEFTGKVLTAYDNEVDRFHKANMSITNGEVT